MAAQIESVKAAAPEQQRSVEAAMLAVSEISDPVRLTEALRDLDQAIADGGGAAEDIIRQSEVQQLALHVGCWHLNRQCNKFSGSGGVHFSLCGS